MRAFFPPNWENACSVCVCAISKAKHTEHQFNSVPRCASLCAVPIISRPKGKSDKLQHRECAAKILAQQTKPVPGPVVGERDGGRSQKSTKRPSDYLQLPARKFLFPFSSPFFTFVGRLPHTKHTYTHVCVVVVKDHAAYISISFP